VDAHPSNVSSRHRSQLEPIARVSIGGAYPDIICSLAGSGSQLIVGIEVKPTPRHWVKGISQARRYREGVHVSYFAAPGPVSGEALAMARDVGIGVLARSEGRWEPQLEPPDPRPRPWTLAELEAALRGVPTARRLQLNHPLNYLVVPYLALRSPGESLYELLERHWPDLSKDSTRRHAVEGAVALGLLHHDGSTTIDGQVAAELLRVIGFTPSSRPSKRRRLCDADPAVAAVGRSVFLRHPAVRLVVDVLIAADRPISTIELLILARAEAPVLADALLLRDAHYEAGAAFHGADFNPPGVFKFRQNLWHLGLVETAAHRTAGKKATDYQPREDFWQVDRRFARVEVAATPPIS
jgi:hypothetical protein